VERALRGSVRVASPWNAPINAALEDHIGPLPDLRRLIVGA